MVRYILIDNNSGFIFADTANLRGFDNGAADGNAAIIDAVRCLNAGMKLDPDTFSYEVGNAYGANDEYTVYRANADMATIYDGQNKSEIELVEESCERVCTVKSVELVD
jgi:hypothetical protein